MNLRKNFNDNGFILALTLLCALIMSSVMVSTMFVSTKGQKVTKNFKESVQTLNAADAAIKQAKQALSAWLISQQMPLGIPGSQVDFDTLLGSSASNLNSANGYSNTLVIPSNSTNWGNLNIFGNTVTVTVTNTEAGASGTANDTDRIIVLQADATSPTRQRVRIKATVQAPSSGNVSSLSLVGLQGAMTMCSDAAGLKQNITFSGNAFVTGNNITTKPGTYVGGSALNLPPIVKTLSAVQTVSTSGNATFEGNPSTVQTMTGNCSTLENMINQISLLSNTLPNVQYISNGSSGNTTLGTAASPKVTIVTGSSGSTSNVSFSGNTTGAGVLMIQAPLDNQDVNTGISGNFQYDGLVILYGDATTQFTTSGNAEMYGGIVILSGTDDATDVVRYTASGNTRIAYRKSSLAYADSAIGSVSVATPISQRDDARNTVLTVGWYEDYNF